MCSLQVNSDFNFCRTDLKIAVSHGRSLKSISCLWKENTKASFCGWNMAWFQSKLRSCCLYSQCCRNVTKFCFPFLYTPPSPQFMSWGTFFLLHLCRYTLILQKHFANPMSFHFSTVLYICNKCIDGPQCVFNIGNSI